MKPFAVRHEDELVVHGAFRRIAALIDGLDRRRSVLFVRHGQTAWTRERRYQGHRDIPLSSEGIGEATGLAGRLSDLGIGAVISSPLSRAFQTAQIIADELGLGQPEVDPRLMEVAYGDWEGLTQQEIAERWPGQLQDWKNAPDSFGFPGGENLEAVGRRLYDFLGEQYARFDEDPTPIVAVTHAGPIRLAVLDARAAPIECFRHIRVEPASVHRFLLHSLDARGKAELLLAGEL